MPIMSERYNNCTISHICVFICYIVNIEHRNGKEKMHLITDRLPIYNNSLPTKCSTKITQVTSGSHGVSFNI